MQYGLEIRHLQTLKEILMPHTQITNALLFGSRVLGTYSLASDVDIALKGDIDIRLIAKLRSNFADSALPFFVDIVDYALANEELKKHIDTKGVELYARDMG